MGNQCIVKLVIQREQAGLERSETLHTSTFRMFRLLSIQNKVHELTTRGKNEKHPNTIIASVTESDVFKYNFVMSGSITVIGQKQYC